MVTLKTDRLLLREFKTTDWLAVHSYASDPQVVLYMDWGPNTKEESQEFIQRALGRQKEKPRRDYTLAIVLNPDNRLIGGCGIYVSSPDNREGWIGYCLNRQHWGKGYATETAAALLKFGFEKLNLHRMFATCDPANTASAHVMEKVGMKLEGRLREHKWSKTRWRDSLLYAILEQEWQSLNKALKPSRGR